MFFFNRKQLTLWEEKMIRAGNLDFVRNKTSMPKTKSSKASAQEFWCPGSTTDETTIHPTKDDIETRANVPIKKENIENKYISDKNYDSFINTEEKLDSHQSQDTGVQMSNTNQSKSQPSVDEVLRKSKEVIQPASDSTKDKEKSSKGIFKTFRKMFKF